MVEIYVRQNNVDQALRALKKKLQNEGILREMKARKHFEKPSEKRVREKAEAVRARAQTGPQTRPARRSDPQQKTQTTLLGYCRIKVLRAVLWGGFFIGNILMSSRIGSPCHSGAAKQNPGRPKGCGLNENEFAKARPSASSAE